MKKQKKQRLLSMVIIILVIALIMMIGAIIYEERINILKQTSIDTNTNTDTALPKEERDNIDENIDKDEDLKDVIEQPDEPKKETEYVGEEENNASKDSDQSKEEKAISLVKKEYGDDESVTFSIEQKDGTKYYVAVKNQDTETIWYEVDIETWKVSEY